MLGLFLSACGDKTVAPQTAELSSMESVQNDIVFSKEELALLSTDAQEEDVLEKDIFFKDPTLALEKIHAGLEDPANTAYKHSLLAMRALAQSQLNNNDAAFDDMTASLQEKATPISYALRSIILWRSGKMRGALLDANYALEKQQDLALGQMAKGLAIFGDAANTQQNTEYCTWLKNACNEGLCYGLNHVQEQGKCQ